MVRTTPILRACIQSGGQSGGTPLPLCCASLRDFVREKPNGHPQDRGCRRAAVDKTRPIFNAHPIGRRKRRDAAATLLRNFVREKPEPRQDKGVARGLAGSASPARLPPPDTQSTPLSCRLSFCWTNRLTCRETKADVVEPAARAELDPAGRPAVPGIVPAGTAAQRAPRFTQRSNGVHF